MENFHEKMELKFDKGILKVKSEENELNLGFNEDVKEVWLVQVGCSAGSYEDFCNIF